jgi:hypothetical protein
LAIVEAAGRAMRVKDFCAELDKLLIGRFDKAAVRKTLNERSRGPNARFRRVGWGLYQQTPWTAPHRGLGERTSFHHRSAPSMRRRMEISRF